MVMSWIGFFELPDHERKMLGRTCCGGGGGTHRRNHHAGDGPRRPAIEKTPISNLDEMGLFHRTETTYRRLWFTVSTKNT